LPRLGQLRREASLLLEFLLLEELGGELGAVGARHSIIESRDHLPSRDALSLRDGRLPFLVSQHGEDVALDGGADPRHAIGQRLRAAQQLGPLAQGRATDDDRFHGRGVRFLGGGSRRFTATYRQEGEQQPSAN
jgi:hypothetical protein